MERCRIDFGVEITRMTWHTVPQNGHVSQHFDLCRIRYTPGNDSDDGVLLYLKPALKGDDPEDLLDRKSTRLNSSHGYISYAVFCLKKKINLHVAQATDHTVSKSQ